MAPFQPKSRDGKDWFRQVSWGEDEQTLFRAKLAKARTWGRPQYLRIQAVTLERKLPHVALRLFEECIALDMDGIQSAWAHDGRAEIFARQGDLEPALLAFEAALDCLSRQPNAIPSATINYPLFVARHGFRDRFERAIAVLDRYEREPTFPIGRFKAAAARALIAEVRLDGGSAILFAATALDAAAETQSEFRYHPDTGLVRAEQAFLIKRLTVIAKGGSATGSSASWLRSLLSRINRR